MAYLYAGLSIAMLTGVMTMLEMASSYLQFQNTWEPASVANSGLYYNGLHLKDQYIMDVISENIDMDVCSSEDTAEIMNSLNLDQSSYEFSDAVSDFKGGCVYTSSSVGHRIIFDSNKGLWSCALASGQQKCDFEL